MIFSPHKIDVVIGFDSSIELGYDLRTREITNVILEKPNLDGRPGEYIVDSNGDGIPEQRRVKTADSNDLFYRGNWYRYKSNGRTALIMVDGRQIEVTYDGTNWSPVGNQ